MVACSAPGNYGDSAIVQKVKFTPLWYTNGELDNNPSPYTADQVNSSMVNSGANFKRIFYPQTDHGTWYQTWSNPDFWPFLNSAYSSNPWTLYGKTTFDSTQNISVIVGLAKGFDAYQWRKDGVVISGATTNRLTSHKRVLMMPAYFAAPCGPIGRKCL